MMLPRTSRSARRRPPTHTHTRKHEKKVQLLKPRAETPPHLKPHLTDSDVFVFDYNYVSCMDEAVRSCYGSSCEEDMMNGRGSRAVKDNHYCAH